MCERGGGVLRALVSILTWLVESWSPLLLFDLLHGTPRSTDGRQISAGPAGKCLISRSDSTQSLSTNGGKVDVRGEDSTLYT